MNIIDPYLLSNLQETMNRVLKDRNYADLRGERYVRIPRVEGRINELENMDESVSLEFVYKRWYDEEARQSRNKKLIIGRITPEFPNALRISENYDQFFDYETGELKEPYRTEIQQERAEKAQKKEKEEKEAPKQPRPRPQENNPHPTSDPAFTDPREEEERIRKEQEAARLEEDRERFFREFRENIQKYKREQLKKKIQGDELERQKELFGDEALSEFQTLQARKRLEKVLGRIRREETEKNKATDTTGQKQDMKQEEENNQKVNNEEANNEQDYAEDDLEKAYARYTEEMERIAVLFKILDGVLNAVRNQAKKKPSEIINSYKARTINQLLQEIREQYKSTGYLELLGLLEEPREEQTEDGRTVQTGMTNSDAEVLLEHYAAITKYAKVKTFKIDD